MAREPKGHILNYEPWDESFARRVLSKVVERKHFLFREFPDYYSQAILLNEAVWAARDGWQKFDSRRSNRSTFIYLCGARRLLVLRRNLSRRLKLETRYAGDRPRFVDTTGEAHEPEGTAEWIGTIQRRLNLMFRAKCTMRRGRPRIVTEAQGAALVILQQTKKLSDRGLELMLSGHPEVRRAIGLSKVPDYRTLGRLRKVGQNSRIVGLVNNSA